VLIVNADDLGADRRSSDAALDGLLARTLSSASAMVWMRDSARSAQIARARCAPVGLHLNLTVPYSDPAAPPAVRDRQQRLAAIVDRDSWWSARAVALDADLVATVVADQLERFRALLGEPTHVDGHHHVHVLDAVLACLPEGIAIRAPLTRPGSEAVERIAQLRARFAVPDACLPFEAVHADLGGAGLHVLARARREAIEVMVHPRDPAQARALATRSWRDLLSEIGAASYAGLRHA
jgi:predicted glycoside hydrolase/deacetylase ChbG (UPF0249 family)